MSKRTSFLFLSFLMFSLLAVSKNSEMVTGDEEEIFEKADQEPSFPGGKDALIKYFEKRISFPELADNNHIDGVVNMAFVVEKDGSVSKTTQTTTQIIAYSNSKFNYDNSTYNQLFIDAVKSAFNGMPLWQPAIKDGQPVRFKKHLKVIFGQPNEDASFPHILQVRIAGNYSIENFYKKDKKPFKDMHMYRVGQDYFISGINKAVSSLSDTDLSLLEKKKAKAALDDILKIISYNTHPEQLVDFTKTTIKKGVSRPLYKGTKDGLDEYMKTHLSTSFGRIYVKASFVVETDGRISCPVVEESNDLEATKMVIKKLRKTKKWQPAMKDGIPVRSRISHLFSYKTVTTVVERRVPVYTPYRQNNRRGW